LVVFQFASSVALIAGTFIVFDQLDYMMDRDIGMNIDQVLVMERPGVLPVDRKAQDTSIDFFRNELTKDPDLKGLSLSLTVPGKQREYKSIIKKYGAPDDTGVPMRVNSMDDHFLEVFEMKLLAGRAFSRDQIKDSDTSVVITESGAKLLGFTNPEDAIGETITVQAFQWNPIVVGVVNDYHQVSLKTSVDPTLFFCTFYGGELYSVRLTTDDVEKSVESIKAAWQKAFAGNPFEYFFLDDYFDRQYENERKFGKLFSTFAGLAIIVGCLGLLGLSAFTTAQRTKEIGIRKVLGSSISSIFLLLTKEYLILIGLALVIAVPVVYVIMDDWISSFSYRTTISWSIFILAGFSVMMVALITVSYQTLKAARSNPVESLRYE
jgi:putative ABC transport system permease protein